jgi:sigma-B regulation protein RsbU (phosphoserine phosphatase)
MNEVLVADDDPAVRLMLRTLLEADGHRVLEARDGNEAWTLIQKHHPRVVVADVRMPGLTGIQLCKKVKEDGHSHVKIIVWTAGMATAQEAADAGCDHFLLKSAPIHELRAAVRSFLG